MNQLKCTYCNGPLNTDLKCVKCRASFKYDFDTIIRPCIWAYE